MERYGSSENLDNHRMDTIHSYSHGGGRMIVDTAEASVELDIFHYWNFIVESTPKNKPVVDRSFAL